MNSLFKYNILLISLPEGHIKYERGIRVYLWVLTVVTSPSVCRWLMKERGRTVDGGFKSWATKGSFLLLIDSCQMSPFR